MWLCPCHYHQLPWTGSIRLLRTTQQWDPWSKAKQIKADHIPKKVKDKSNITPQSSNILMNYIEEWALNISSKVIPHPITDVGRNEWMNEYARVCFEYVSQAQPTEWKRNGNGLTLLQEQRSISRWAMTAVGRALGAQWKVSNWRDASAPLFLAA